MGGHLEHAAGSPSHAHVSPPPHIPSPQEVGLAPTKIPYFSRLHSSGGHQHVHSDAPALAHFNETKYLEAKGPEALSYIEWDLAYGAGSTDSLRRFASQDYSSLDAAAEEGAMMLVDGRFRRLSDGVDGADRRAVAEDILSRVGTTHDPLEPSRHKWLLILHVVSAVLSCFVLLPLALFMRAAESSLAPLATLVYVATLAGSLFVSTIYKAVTPKLYADNAHGRMGWVILWLSLLCLGGDLFRLVYQIVAALRRAGGTGTSKLRSILAVALGRPQSELDDSEKPSHSTYSALEEERMLDDGEGEGGGGAEGEGDDQWVPPTTHHHVHFAQSLRPDSLGSPESGSVSPTSTLIGGHPPHTRSNSLSDALLQKLPWKATASGHTSAHSWKPSTSTAHPRPRPRPRPRSRARTLRAIARYTHVVVARALPILAFATAYTGLAVYTGSCRKAFVNGCMAHGIKGGIFFWYGLLTFARYLGAYADCGWSWNRRPSPETARKRGAATTTTGYKASMPSSEWVECLIIFVYGASNTWMERFEAKPGDPYTVKQVQHISIAVMYWFAGTVGLLLETRWVRDLLSFPVALHHPSARAGSEQARTGERPAGEAIVAAQTPPPSYSGSFNPFPALCVGITGLAMAAHHQDYVYEVEIHMLWGNLLAGFAVLRCLTYFFLWLRPPTSILPSRPPTEALASFALTCGGLVFMVSTEEVSFAAMRNGFGDFMAILCISVAFICLVFALVAALFVVKAWAVRREHERAREREEERPSCSHRQQSSLPLGRTDGGAGEQAPEHEHERDGDETEPVFVLGDDDGGEESSTRTRTHTRTLSTSPERLV
ncbi:unnamed protein product [Parajaminaea phylloscopi]